MRFRFLALFCASGGALIGYSANHLTEGLNAFLFMLGIVTVSVSLILMGTYQRKKYAFRWVRLPHSFKTADAYQAINLLKENHIRAMTVPDEFNGRIGNHRMTHMDSETMWPIYVLGRHAEQASSILSKEHLF